MSQFPYTLEDLLQTEVRIAYAPISGDAAARIADIQSPISPYALVSPWLPVGATTGPAQVSRGLTVSGMKIQQASGTVRRKPTEVVRGINAPSAEVRPEILQILEQSPSIDTVTAAANKSGEKQIPFGSIEDLTRYRVAFIGRFDTDQGIVTEHAGGLTRGRLVAYIAHRCTIAGDTSQVSFDRENETNVPLSFDLEPDPDFTDQGTEMGYWAIEDSGVISAT